MLGRLALPPEGGGNSPLPGNCRAVTRRLQGSYLPTPVIGLARLASQATHSEVHSRLLLARPAGQLAIQSDASHPWKVPCRPEPS